MGPADLIQLALGVFCALLPVAGLYSLIQQSKPGREESRFFGGDDK